jgi:predicted anti-sigma-YlaC factor YlaD
MRCDVAQEWLSARLDGELPDGDELVLDDHLEGCAACRNHAEDLALLHRAVRVRAAEPVPDLSAAVLAAAAPLLPRRHAVDLEWVRYALFAVALTQLVLALPLLLLGDDPDATIHVARELGAFDVALAAGLLVAAWQPVRARGLLPMALALGAGMAVTAVADVARGDAPALGEAHHVLDLVGMALLWALARRTPGTAAGGRIPAAA